MTMVHIRLRAPTNGGTRAGVGMVVFQPSARHTDDASVVLPDTFTVVLDEEGEATVDIKTMIDSMPRFLTGHGSPTIDGKPGDIYLDLDTMDLYTNNQERN